MARATARARRCRRRPGPAVQQTAASAFVGGDGAHRVKHAERRSTARATAAVRPTGGDDRRHRREREDEQCRTDARPRRRRSGERSAEKEVRRSGRSPVARVERLRQRQAPEQERQASAASAISRAVRHRQDDGPPAAEGGRCTPGDVQRPEPTRLPRVARGEGGVSASTAHRRRRRDGLSRRSSGGPAACVAARRRTGEGAAVQAVRGHRGVRRRAVARSGARLGLREAPPDAEVIVIDDGSRDATGAVARRHGVRVACCATMPTGPGRARNAVRGRRRAPCSRSTTPTTWCCPDASRRCRPCSTSGPRSTSCSPTARAATRKDDASVPSSGPAARRLRRARRPRRDAARRRRLPAGDEHPARALWRSAGLPSA